MNVVSNVHKEVIEDQKSAGVDVIGVGLHTVYDHLLDWTVRLGLIPSRFTDARAKLDRLDLTFAMARGTLG